MIAGYTSAAPEGNSYVSKVWKSLILWLVCSVEVLLTLTATLIKPLGFLKEEGGFIDIIIYMTWYL